MKQIVKNQLNLIQRGVENLINKKELESKIENSLTTGIPIHIKLAVDPTAPDIHLGHTVVFRKLRHFQDLGHEIYFLIGDFTARIEDPSGRDKTRPPLTEEQILHNAQSYLDQIFKVFLVCHTEFTNEIKFNDHLISKTSDYLFDKQKLINGIFTIMQN